MGTFEELPIELQISIMEYAVNPFKEGMYVYQLGYNEHIPISRCFNEVHTPTSSYLKYDNGWLQTVYDYNNNAYEPKKSCIIYADYKELI